MNAEESVSLQRKLAHPVFNLSDSLNIIAKCYSDLNRHREALDAVVEATALFEPLAKQLPLVHNEGLAASLFILSTCYSNLDSHDDALEPAQRSLRMYRELFQTRPLVFEEKIAPGVQRVKDCLSALGRQAEADELDAGEQKSKGEEGGSRVDVDSSRLADDQEKDAVQEGGADAVEEGGPQGDGGVEESEVPREDVSDGHSAEGGHEDVGNGATGVSRET
ncbi:hypothetical protein NLI96_g11278 [Meripilus lineatus]|uniref:Tetratricopeptide repeat-containing protein n=1 Tax=Meripilus lineatus TaxID=2056292 RepID=A0AAD5USE0_9APHY|nr:hypothetical protein NLI96_g11278 [Physisporinus lineatus]